MAARKSPAGKTAAKKTPKPANDAAAVDEYMKQLDHPLKAEIAAIRAIIVNANSKIAERVKWNAPSFYYKIDLAAFNTRQQKFVQLIVVFPKDTTIVDDTGLLEGDYKDRREARFLDMKDVKAKKARLEKVVNDWVALVERVV